MWAVLVLIFALGAYAEQAKFLDPCTTTDIPCVRVSTGQFLENTAAGNPEYGLKKIDPYAIPSLDIPLDSEIGVHLTYKDLIITGLKSQNVTDFKLNKETHDVYLQTSSTIHIAGDLVIDLTEVSKKFEGAYNADATILTTTKYKYSIKKKAPAVEHFDVGPEVTECELIGEPTVALGPELQAALDKDPDAKARLPAWQKKVAAHRSNVICTLAKKGYEGVVHNIRTSAQLLPKQSFFTDV